MYWLALIVVVPSGIINLHVLHSDKIDYFEYALEKRNNNCQH